MILARHAEAFFWAGRQLERIEHTTRVLDVSTRNAMHYRPERAVWEWERVLGSLGLMQAYERTERPVTQAEVSHYLFIDPTHTGSVPQVAQSLRENVRTVRDRIPVELWEEANRLYLSLHGQGVNPITDDEDFEKYSRVRRGCQATTGVIAEAMPRDEGYAFLRIGRMIERAGMVCRLVRSGMFEHKARHLGEQDGQDTVAAADEAAAGDDVAALLRMASSLQAHRRTNGYVDDPVTVALLLLRDSKLPRSVLSCVREAEAQIAPLANTATGLVAARRIVGRLRAELEFGPLELELSEEPVDRISRIEVDLASLSTVVAINAFDPAHSSVLTSQFVRPGSELS